MTAHIELPREVVIAIQEGHTIEAIKLLREAKGLGLVEAKQAVDAYIKVHPVLEPAQTGSSGFLVFVIFIVLAIFGYFVLI